jgi:thioredoxin 2
METDIVTCPHCGKRNRVPAAAAGKPRCANCHQWLPWIAAAGDRDFAEVAENHRSQYLSTYGRPGVDRVAW